mgnify:CR=1 FL=1
MSIKLQLPKLMDLKPRITVLGVGGRCLQAEQGGELDGDLELDGHRATSEHEADQRVAEGLALAVQLAVGKRLALGLGRSQPVDIARQQPLEAGLPGQEIGLVQASAFQLGGGAQLVDGRLDARALLGLRGAQLVALSVRRAQLRGGGRARTQGRPR